MAAADSARWSALWERAEASGDPAPGFRDLAARYAEPLRAYHTLVHIGHCLGELEAARDLARDAVAVEFAIWFHDAVYNPRASDNEERSAGMAVDVLRAGGVAGDRILRVASMIRASTHRGIPDDPDARLFADIDLSILGQDDATFDEYELGVRREYSFVPDILFRSGRASILRAFLKRPALYGTDFFRDRYEQAARRNLERSLRKGK